LKENRHREDTTDRYQDVWNEKAFIVIPANAGIHRRRSVNMDAGFRRHDNEV
jgi:hypothetical protein